MVVAALHCSPSITGLIEHCWLVGLVTLRVWVREPRTGQTKFTTCGTQELKVGQFVEHTVTGRERGNKDREG